jgi:hypothetical protein
MKHSKEQEESDEIRVENTAQTLGNFEKILLPRL